MNDDKKIFNSTYVEINRDDERFKDWFAQRGNAVGIYDVVIGEKIELYQSNSEKAEYVMAVLEGNIDTLRSKYRFSRKIRNDRHIMVFGNRDFVLLEHDGTACIVSCKTILGGLRLICSEINPSM